MLKQNSSKPIWTVLSDENAKGGLAAAKPRADTTKPRGVLGDIGNIKRDAAQVLPGKAPFMDLKRGLSVPSLLRKEDPMEVSDTLDIDLVDQNDEFACTEYTNDIDRHLRHAEGRYMVSSTYMTTQSEINERMRSILIDWLVVVHLKFKLRHETLFLTVNIIDRFLEKSKVARNKLQLVGVTSLMIAAKYEEIYPPEVRDYVFICDNAYTRNQIIQMEPIILNTLGFRFTVATPHTFLRRFCKAGAGREGDEQLYNAAGYVLENSLLEYNMIAHLPSILVAASVSIAMSMLGRPSWTPTLTKYTRYTEAAIAPVKEQLLTMLREAPSSTLTGISKKYSNPKYNSVASLPLPSA